VKSSNQVSLSYNNVGMIQVSKILQEDQGFSHPERLRVSRAKKALLALLMLSETEFMADRLELHYTPRHFEAFEVVILELPTAIS
jgi:hypothetical protein